MNISALYNKMTSMVSSPSATKLKALIRALRPNQWIKNFSIFAAIVFTGQLFNVEVLSSSIIAFLLFSALSSASYLLNDIVDLPYDRLHPDKKYRPLASGRISVNEALQALMILAFIGLAGAFFLDEAFFFVALIFFLLHVLYSLILKKVAVLDILAIATSFMLRVFAGEVLTGFYPSIWLTITVVFLSLFIASCKRRSELELEGEKTRPTLAHYRMRLLDLYTSTFATATILTYSLFSFLGSNPEDYTGPLGEVVSSAFPQVVGRKLMILTLPFMLYAIMRYAQLIYEKPVGEKPEALVTQDRPLVISIVLWGLLTIFIVYGL